MQLVVDLVDFSKSCLDDCFEKCLSQIEAPHCVILLVLVIVTEMKFTQEADTFDKVVFGCHIGDSAFGI